MILHRIATALRKQDWITVAIEMCIVVIGVYYQIIFSTLIAKQLRAELNTLGHPIESDDKA